MVQVKGGHTGGLIQYDWWCYTERLEYRPREDPLRAQWEDTNL